MAKSDKMGQNSRKTCPKGHCFDDDKLIYCPECGLPLLDYPIDQKHTINQHEANNIANKELQQSFRNNSSTHDSTNDSKKTTLKKMNRKRWIAGILSGLLLLFFILELTDTTCIVTFLHNPRVTNAQLSPIMNILITDHTNQIKQMAKEGENWTETYTPKTIDELPYFPKQLLSLYNALDKVYFSIEREGTTYIVHTNVGNLLSNQGELTIITNDRNGHFAELSDSNVFLVSCEDDLPVVGLYWTFECLDIRKNTREDIDISFDIDNGKLINPCVTMALFFDPHIDQKYGFIWTGEPEVHYQIENGNIGYNQNHNDRRIMIFVRSGDVEYNLSFAKDGQRYYFNKTGREIR